MVCVFYLCVNACTHVCVGALTSTACRRMVDTNDADLLPTRAVAFYVLK